jgi:shikimate dehydrogenase
VEKLPLCLIGDGVGGSPSRALQEAALAATGREGSYEIVNVDPAGLPGVLRELRAGRWRGANITAPYKFALATVCDELEGDAARTGAVNTITVEPEGRLCGGNTDATGFELALSARRLWPLPESRAMVIGAGGAAAAVLLALSRVPVLRTTVVARRINADIIVNATSAGLADMPFTPAQLQASCTVADVRYRPRPVDVTTAAAEAGRRSIDGLDMLFHQGMLSFRRWTGDEPPYADARRALDEAVGA